MNHYVIKYLDEMWIKFTPEKAGNYSIVRDKKEATKFWTRPSAASAIEAYVNHLDSLISIEDDKIVLKSYFTVVKERTEYAVTDFSDMTYRGGGK